MSDLHHAATDVPSMHDLFAVRGAIMSFCAERGATVEFPSLTMAVISGPIATDSFHIQQWVSRASEEVLARDLAHIIPDPQGHALRLQQARKAAKHPDMSLRSLLDKGLKNLRLGMRRRVQPLNDPELVEITRPLGTRWELFVGLRSFRAVEALPAELVRAWGAPPDALFSRATDNIRRMKHTQKLVGAVKDVRGHYVGARVLTEPPSDQGRLVAAPGLHRGLYATLRDVTADDAMQQIQDALTVIDEGGCGDNVFFQHPDGRIELVYVQRDAITRELRWVLSDRGGQLQTPAPRERRSDTAQPDTERLKPEIHAAKTLTHSPAAYRD